MGLIAQLVQHCTSIAEVMSLILIQAWIFQAVFRYCLSSINNSCDELKNHNMLLALVQMSLTYFQSYIYPLWVHYGLAKITSSQLIGDIVTHL